MADFFETIRPACTGINIFLWLLLPVAISAFFLLSRRHSKKQEEIKARFFEEEEAANSVRKKDIEPELFYTPDLSVLPPLPPDDPHQIERAAKRTMLRFPQPMTNLELKKNYGLAQMDIIAQYEENFSEYLKALTKWGVATATENPADALTILETVAALGGEFRDTYKTAADIYAARGDSEKLDALFTRAEENYFRDPSIKRQILDYIETKREAI